MLARLDDPPPQQPQRRWRWRRRSVVAGLVVVGIAGTASVAIAAWYSTSTPRDPLDVACWSDQQRSSQWEVRIGLGDSPLTACGTPWDDGTFGRSGPPPLVACTSAEGIIAVVPAESCAKVGLDGLTPGYEDSTSAQTADLLQQLIGDRLFEECHTEVETRSLIDGVLAEHGLDDWTVESPVPFTADRPCGQVAIDPTTRTITIVTIRSH
ncbi:MAG TPA: hypothetical protein PLV68_02660 [Ilumatobacteraceae bacterium]|nr:hypothetical protein [Ilumatobacteraceae bacterium]